MKNSKEFPFKKARRLTPGEVRKNRRAIEDFVGQKRLNNLISAKGRLKVKDISAELRKMEPR
jgi:hypothetical protein